MTDHARQAAERLFPIIPYTSRDKHKGPHPMRVPWSIAELAYSVYASRYGRSQSLERLAERGGFHAGEMDDLLPDWRERCSAIDAATADKQAQLSNTRRDLAIALRWIATAERIGTAAGYTGATSESHPEFFAEQVEKRIAELRTRLDEAEGLLRLSRPVIGHRHSLYEQIDAYFEKGK